MTETTRVDRSGRDRALSAVAAVERALTPDEQRDLLAIMTRLNPRLKGAHVADVLDLLYDSDGAIRWTEPFWEARAAAGRSGSDGDGSDRLLFAYAAIAVAVLEQGVPDGARVDALVEQARGELR